MIRKYYGVEYIPDDQGIAVKVKCPLVDDWISDADCLDNQSVAEPFIPGRYKQKRNWKEMCKQCPFRDY